MKHGHYYKDVRNLEQIDVYRVLELFEVANPCLQHAIKKLLCSGTRGSKNQNQDVAEAIDTLLRYQEMRVEGQDVKVDGADLLIPEKLLL